MLRSKVLRPVCERRKGSIQWRGGACASALLHLGQPLLGFGEVRYCELKVRSAAVGSVWFVAL